MTRRAAPTATISLMALSSLAVLTGFVCEPSSVLSSIEVVPSLFEADQGRVDVALFGTGVDETGTVLGNGAVDPHYALIGSPDPAYPGPDAKVLNTDSPPLQGGYVPNTAGSRWIGPRADGGGNLPSGQCELEYPGLDCFNVFYEYQTTFDLTGLDPASVLIEGRWACDDAGEIFLNGVSTGIIRLRAPGPDAAFRSWADFTISSGFVPGINTLLFRIQNTYFPGNPGPNATGLRVEILSATADPVPDLCPDDPEKTEPGACGCGTPDTDADGDGTPDCQQSEECPEDLEAPQVSCAVAVGSLWPANHELTNVGLSVTASDDCDRSPHIDVAVYSNEPVNAAGSGNTSPDAADIAPGTLRLRAERSGKGAGRVYLVIVTATDGAGRSATTACTIVVPHSQSKASVASVESRAAAALQSFNNTGQIPGGFVLLSQ